MRKISRRDFVTAATVVAGATPLVLATACGPTTTPAPASATKPATQPTTAGAAPAAATGAPAVAAKPAATTGPARLGDTLIHPTPEWSEVITDPAKYPKSFKEAPMLAELVKAGKLPPVEKRLPEEPLVIKPVHEIGKYGGIWRRGFTGPGDVINGFRTASGPDLMLYLGPDLKTILPNIAKGYEMSKDFKTFTLFLRKGAKWSDGNPYTADDFVFWFEDVYSNKELIPTGDARMSVGGKPGKIEKVDTYTVRWVFPESYPFFPRVMSLFNQLSSHAQYGEAALGSVSPAHYMKQFHPKYVSKEELDKKVKDAKFDNWTMLFKNRGNWSLNPDLPTMSPWKTVSPANTATWSFERNPYSIWVDTDGNQLPYIDRIVMTLAETAEVVNLRAIAGEYDMQARHIDIAKIPVLLENQQKGGYKVSSNPGTWGSDYGIWFNMGYEADPEINKWFNNRDFRRALSMGIDREQVNEAFFLGIGITGSAAPAETNPYNPGPEWRKKWATLDIKLANEMLDKIGLDKKDSDGFRLRSDGKGRLTVNITAVAAAPIAYTTIGEMIKQHWKKIGIDLNVQETERSLASTRNQANECQLYSWLNDSSDDPLSEPTYNFPSMPSSFMPLYGRWFSSGGKQGKEPPAEIRKVMDLWTKAVASPPEEATPMVKEMWKTLIDEVWYIGVVGQSGAQEGTQVTKVKMGNVPRRWIHLNRQFAPNIARPICFYWKE